MNFKIYSKIGPITLYYSKMVFGQILPKMTRIEFSIFIKFSDAYTCTNVA